MTDAVTRLTAALSDRYRIERELGEGGMATVYLADDLKHDRKVAIKVLKPELAAVIGGERFLTEIRTTANLQHPHILPLFDSGEAESFLFYVMPYIEGESLRGMIDRERQLAVDDAVRIARDIAEALDYAHRHDVIHRDIKPENILIHDGNPVVADFGIALAVSAAGGGRMTETGLSLGTPHYMSPEQASADRDLSNRSDIYSLGCMLYEMLAGQPPHTGPSAQSVLVRILTETPRPLSEQRHSVPPHISAAVSKAIEKLPADRFATADEFAKALDDRTFAYTAPMRAVTGTTDAPARAPQPTRLGHPTWRRALPWAAAAAGLALAGASWISGRGTPTPAAFDLHLGDVQVSAFMPPEVSANGATFGVMVTMDGERALLIRRRHEADLRPLVSGVNGFAISPDGNWVAYVDASESSIKRISVDGGAPNTLMDAERHRPGELWWGDDGYIVFYSSGREVPSGAYRVQEVGGQPELVHAGGWIYFPRSLPGGRGYLLTDGNAGSVALLEAGADSARTVIPEGVGARYIDTGHLVYTHPEGGLQVVSFDLGGLAVTGTPIPVRDEVSARFGAGLFSISRDGTLVYLRGVAAGSGDERELVSIDLEGGGTETYPLSPRQFGAVDLDPAGRRVAFTVGPGFGAEFQDRNAWMYDLELRTSPRQLTFDGRVSGLAWSPEGDQMALSRSTEEGIELLVKTVEDDLEPTVVPTPTGSRLFVLDWYAPDSILTQGRLEEDGTADLWITPMDGGESRPYLRSENALRYGRVSPSGSHVLYVESDDDKSALAVRRFPEAGQPVPIAQRPYASSQFLSAAHWGPSGDVVYFLVGGERADSLYAAHLRLAPTLALDSTRLVLETPSNGFGGMALLPDGSRMIGARPVVEAGDTEDDETPDPRAVVVLHWFQELMDRLEGR